MNFSKKEQKRLLQKYGPWAVVSGASSGIGRELATRIAEAGLNLIISARSHDKLLSLQKQLMEDYKVRVEIVVADLVKDGIDQLVNAAKDKKNGLLVASAGFGTSGYFIKNSVHAEANLLEVNCIALMQLTHHFAQKFVQEKRGGIILLSSMVAFQGVPFSANYSASKAYVQSLAEGLYHELKPHQVDVLAAAPGPVKTAFEQKANMQMDMAMSAEKVGVPILKALGRKMTVLPGNLTKVLVYSLRTVPRWAKIQIMKSVMGGMTRHQSV